jgi:hypothetical protein
MDRRRAFWSAGPVGLALTDTAQFRSPYYDDVLDTPDSSTSIAWLASPSCWKDRPLAGGPARTATGVAM